MICRASALAPILALGIAGRASAAVPYFARHKASVNEHVGARGESQGNLPLRLGHLTGLLGPRQGLGGLRGRLHAGAPANVLLPDHRAPPET
jgi:hypothetical protein